MKKWFEDLYNRIENAVKKYWVYGLKAVGLLIVGIGLLVLAYRYWPSKKVEVVSTATTTNTTPELVNGNTNTLSLKEAQLQSQTISNLQVQLAEAKRQALTAVAPSVPPMVPASATNIVVTVPAEVLRAVPTNLPTPPANGMAFGVGIVQGDLNLNIGSDGTITIGDKKKKKDVRHPEGMPERPAYTTNILESGYPLNSNKEVHAFHKVPPGDGVRFTKPTGWTVVAGVYTKSFSGVKVFASKDAFMCLINVGTMEDPEWIETEFADQRQTPIEAESYWIWSTRGRKLDVMFILTPTPAE